MLFQSTHPSGVRRPSTRRASPTRHFNPRTPVGCDVPVLVLACIGDRISIHAPQWGATSAYHQSPAGALFQSTHPSGVRPTDSAAIVRCKQFQSTHPSGVRPPSGDCGRSATADFNPRTPVGCDSYRHHHNKRFHPFQSTHPSGVRPFDGAKSVGKSSDFNPRTPVGCDGIAPDKRLEAVIFQSTHPSGVRHAPFENPLAIFKFQSTHPSGVRRFLPTFCPHYSGFQSTHPSGVRRGRHRVRPHHDPISIHAPQWGATAMRRRRPSDALFQSTHPSGVRPWRPVQVGRPQRISIHAPQWGATHALGHDNGAVGISIHAPQWGATADYRPARFQDWISIHAPQWGATTSGLFLVLKWIVFQSTHPSGVRRLRPVLHTVHGRISIHAPQWGATRRAVRWYTAIRNFNPRIPVGCDHDYPVFQYASGVFQSTHPSGVRPELG